MMLSGLPLRDSIKSELKTLVASLKKEQVPSLAIVQVGNHEPSHVYIKGKKKFAEEIGIEVFHHQLSETVSEEDVASLIQKLNADSKIGGIIIQLPLPTHLNKYTLIEAVDPEKDVDGLCSVNVKKLQINDPTGIMPATARAVLSLLVSNNIALEGKKVLVIGRSDLVGKPTAMALLNQNATVTIAHNLSRDLPQLCEEAEIIVSIAGAPGLLTKEHVKKGGQIIIDVGITRVEGKIKGDADYEEVLPLVSGISPVPGGVGPLTIASLFQNLLRKYTRGTVIS